jgi:competence protein ComEC
MRSLRRAGGIMGATPRRTAPTPRAPDAPVRDRSLPAVLSDTLASERGGALARVSTRASAIVLRGRDVASALLERERETGSFFNFVPVCLGLGIIAYFLAPAEPVFAVVAASSAVLTLAAIARPVHGPGFFVLAAAALFLAGMSSAQLRTMIAGGPVIAVETTGKVRGLVLGVEATRKGGVRYLLRPLSIEGVQPEGIPERIRLSAASRHEMVRPGGVIEGVARLQPFSGPAYPGSFDFGFFNWFDGLGATGFFMGAPSAAQVDAATNLAEKSLVVMNRLRIAMTSRIRAAVGGEAGDICAALITGERMAVDEATEESFRRSGLAHILSISGLHMVLVTLTAVWLLRFSLALSPRLALHYPVRKWAVATGFGSATFYLFLSGAEVATQRSYLMIAVMLFATLIDRRAMTMRNVALAALVILVLTPEAVLEPGFQMSFAAAAALVAAYGAAAQFRQARHGESEKRAGRFGFAGKFSAYLGGLLMTSLVAGLATGLFGAWHFHRVAPMGLVSNLIAAPVISLVMMPSALISVLLMPYGAEKLALVPMGWSVEAVVAISNWVNRYPVPDETGKQPLVLLLAGTAGLLVMVLLRTRLRLLGLLPLAALGLLAESERPPDLIVSQGGKAVGMADAQGRLALLYKGRDSFIAGIWQKAWPAGGEGDAASLTKFCDKEHCIAISPGGVRVEIVYNPDLLEAACTTADILIAPRLRYVNCKERQPDLVLKRNDFEERGTHLVRFGEEPGDGGLVVRTAIASDDRPWNLARRPPPTAPSRSDQKAGLAPVSSGGSDPQDGPEPSPGPD